MLLQSNLGKRSENRIIFTRISQTLLEKDLKLISISGKTNKLNILFQSQLGGYLQRVGPRVLRLYQMQGHVVPSCHGLSDWNILIRWKGFASIYGSYGPVCLCSLFPIPIRFGTYLFLKGVTLYRREISTQCVISPTNHVLA